MSAWSNTPTRTGSPLVFFRLSFFLLAILLLGACAPAPDATLRMGLASAPVTLDPRFATDATSSRINRLLYARLVEFDEQQRPAPGLARWERLGPSHYRFVLQASDADRTFSDGSRLSARDVKATYDSVLDPATASPHRASLSMIRRIAVIDDDTVDFFLSKPDRLFPGYLVIGILPAAKLAAQHPFNRQPVGSGPFRLLAWPEEGRLQLLRRRDGQAISFVRVSDATVRVLKLLRGELDMLQNDLPPELIVFLQDRPGIRVSRARGSNFTYLGFNLQDEIVGQRDVRRAIALAIDREKIIRYVMGKAARPASALLPPEHWAGNPGLPLIDYDPEAARALLAKHGYTPQHPLKISYKTSTNAFRLRLATVLQSQLKEVGIDIDLRSYDWGTFYGDIKAGNFQMFSLSWVGIKTPDIFRYVFHSESVPPNGANRGRFRDSQVDRLIEAAERAESLAAQAAAYRQLQARLLETLPYVPLWYEDHVFVAHKGISGYKLGLDGNYDGLRTVHVLSNKPNKP
ncbi:MAG TPA: ABC transporter substrate-binding protein [Gammaproteobacteria bacterium]|nr:ABC transporter substrate-binding protein [Gammaproteobacteria bacterium]